MWWGIQMCCETEPGLEPLKKAYVKPTSCGIKTTAQAIILSCVVKSSWWGQWWNMTRNTCKNFIFLPLPKTWLCIRLLRWDETVSAPWPPRRTQHWWQNRLNGSSGSSDSHLAFSVVQPLLNGTAECKKPNGTNPPAGQTQTEPGRALSRLSQAMAQNSGMPCSAQ